MPAANLLTLDASMDRVRACKQAGIDPHGSDDTVFDATWVYCVQHVRAHPTGWCTVANYDKIPLAATTAETALAETRAKGLPIHGDPCPCAHCGTPINHDRKAVGTGYGEGYRCAQAPGRDTRHTPTR